MQFPSKPQQIFWEVYKTYPKHFMESIRPSINKTNLNKKVRFTT